MNAKALPILLVVLLLILGIVLVALAVRAYHETGNVAAVVFALVLTVGILSGAVAVWRNTRRFNSGTRSHDADAT